MSTIKCPECGRKVEDGDEICQYCGFPLKDAVEKNDTEKISVEKDCIAEYPRQEKNINCTENKKSFKIIIICMCVIMVLFSAVFIMSKHKEPTVKDTLTKNIEYVRKHMVGTWKSDGGAILEIYSNGYMVNYTPNVSDYMEIEPFIREELDSVGYNGYTIKEAADYSEEDLDSYATYLKRTEGTGIIGIAVQANFWGVIDDKYIIFEFRDDDRMNMGDIALTRISSGDPDLSDGVTGFYVNETDKTATFSVIQVRGKDMGYFEWGSGKLHDAIKESCTISDSQIILHFPYADDFVFKKQGQSIVEIGSAEIPGSGLQYIKISDLSLCGKLEDGQFENERLKQRGYNLYYGITDEESGSDDTDYNGYDNNENIEVFTVKLHNRYNPHIGSVTVAFGQEMPTCSLPQGNDSVKFMGYFSGENGTGTQYYDKNMNSTHCWDKESDGELYAYWAADNSLTPDNFKEYFEIKTIGQRNNNTLEVSYRIYPKEDSFSTTSDESSDSVSVKMRISVKADLNQKDCDTSYDAQKTVDFVLLKSDNYTFSGTEPFNFPDNWGCYTDEDIIQCSGTIEKY